MNTKEMLEKVFGEEGTEKMMKAAQFTEMYENEYQNTMSKAIEKIASIKGVGYELETEMSEEELEGLNKLAELGADKDTVDAVEAMIKITKEAATFFKIAKSNEIDGEKIAEMENVGVDSFIELLKEDIKENNSIRLKMASAGYPKDYIEGIIRGEIELDDGDWKFAGLIDGVATAIPKVFGAVSKFQSSGIGKKITSISTGLDVNRKAKEFNDIASSVSGTDYGASK